ncbi:MAG: Lipolytic enzyme precursor [Frankiales bacterium]|nr:Lipolytic enzyme precursor [Frankiales bacterium]
MAVTAPAPRRGLRRLPVFDRSYAQVAQYADDWAASNARARAQDGPLWLVLGDSAAQGVGASSYLGGYVGQVLPRLGQRDGRAWRVVNLSRSGARTRDALGQWQSWDGPSPDLVTALVGGNDALGTRLPQWLLDLDALLTALPRDAVVGTVARGVFERKVRRYNDVLREAAPAAGLRVADLWSHTGPPYRGRYADGFHPNDLGYTQWADALGEALGLG